MVPVNAASELEVSAVKADVPFLANFLCTSQVPAGEGSRNFVEEESESAEVGEQSRVEPDRV